MSDAGLRDQVHGAGAGIPSPFWIQTRLSSGRRISSQRSSFSPATSRTALRGAVRTGLCLVTLASR